MVPLSDKYQAVRCHVSDHDEASQQTLNFINQQIVAIDQRMAEVQGNVDRVIGEVEKKAVTLREEIREIAQQKIDALRSRK